MHAPVLLRSVQFTLVIGIPIDFYSIRQAEWSDRTVLDLRFVLMFCILAACVHCICVLPLSGVIKNNSNNNNSRIGMKFEPEVHCVWLENMLWCDRCRRMTESGNWGRTRTSSVQCRWYRSGQTARTAKPGGPPYRTLHWGLTVPAERHGSRRLHEPNRIESCSLVTGLQWFGLSRV